MLLRTSLTSPFGRKIRMASLRLGLTHRIQTVSADTTDPADAIRTENPLGKVPLLVLDDGRRVYDSRVILECLDQMAGGGVLIPREWNDRLETLVLQALGDGIMDASVLVSYESRYRPEEIRSAKWLDHQTGKIRRGLDHLTAKAPDPARFDVATISISCMLGYLDWRKQVDWRAEFPALIGWLDAFRASAPEFDATARDAPA
ncbi:MAG: glutathione S-transferase N-terminal domain-containing protein [Beijerinckiaceae bacterium]